MTNCRCKSLLYKHILVIKFIKIDMISLKCNIDLLISSFWFWLYEHDEAGRLLNGARNLNYWCTWVNLLLRMHVPTMAVVNLISYLRNIFDKSRVDKWNDKWELKRNLNESSNLSSFTFLVVNRNKLKSHLDTLTDLNTPLWLLSVM